MNLWNPWETTLRSWTPRPPSSRLKERIFAKPSTSTRSAPTDAKTFERWPALAPALALVLLFSFLTGPGPQMAPTHGPMPSFRQLIGESHRPEETFASLGSSMHSPHNNLQKATFEWTNESPSLTTSLPFSGTNSLFH